MSKILLILVGSLVIFSALIYLLYSLNIKKANTQIYWHKKQIRNKGNNPILNKIYTAEQLLKVIQELILFTVKCRNFVQKISSDLSNLLLQSSSTNNVWSGELQFMDEFLKENDQRVKDLNNFKLTHRGKLSKETDHFIDQLTECMLENQEIIENIIHFLSDQQVMIDELSDLNTQISTTHAQLVELHKWIINYFQEVFANSQGE